MSDELTETVLCRVCGGLVEVKFPPGNKVPNTARCPTCDEEMPLHAESYPDGEGGSVLGYEMGPDKPWPPED